MSWKNDEYLGAELRRYVAQNYKRSEVLDYVTRDFPMYPWSLRSLERRLKHFGVRYIDYNVSIDEVKDAVKEELTGPGTNLGYRAMHKKIREKYNLLVPRDLVHNVLYEENPEGLESRNPMIKKKKKGHFVSAGPNWVHSLDGHDKLMGYQNSTFPLAIYGCMDTCSRKILWLRVWTTNSKPELIGKWYLDYLSETGVAPNYLRIDRGTETGVMATIHSYLHRDNQDLQDPTDSVIYGPSTSNQVSQF